MGHVTYCTLCLVTDVKIFNMNSVMVKTYNEVINTHNNLSMDQVFACYECAHLLYKYKEFKEKCCIAYNLLCSIDFQITEASLKEIDREQNNLKSKLTPCRDYLIYHIFEKQDKKNVSPKMRCVQKNVSKNKLKTESVSNFEEQIVNPLEIDEKFIKKEKAESINSKESIGSSSYVEIELECDKTENKFKVEMEDGSENDNDNENENDNCSDSSSEDSDSNKDCTNDVRDSSGVIDASAIDRILDSDNDDDDKDHIDKESEELDKLLKKYPTNIPPDTKKLTFKTIEWTSEESTLLRKNEVAMRHERLAKRRKTSSDVSPNMLHAIEELLKIKSSGSVINKRKVTKKTCTKTGTKKKKYQELDRSFFDNYVTIIDLTPEDATREVLARKETLNYKASKYKCELCFKGFITGATFQTHMKKHSEEEGPVKCDFCQIRFSTNRALRGHMKSCHTYKFICLKCPYVCSSPTQIKGHIDLHKGKQYSCNECGMKFRYPHTVLSHQRVKHKVEVVCELCGNVYALEKGLVAHKGKFHRNEKNEFQGPKCDECNVHFSNEKAWKRHLVLCTKHKVSNGCEVCGETFNDRNGLREHSRQHENRKRRYNTTFTAKRSVVNKKETFGPCNYCGSPLGSMREYKNHMSKYHPDSEEAKNIRLQLTNTIVCEVCGLMFKHPYFLKVHQRSHTGEKPYACTKCDKRFAVKSTLQSHQATHADESQTQYKCHICGKGYCTKGRLAKHIKYHAERLFQCPSCDKTFTYLYEVNNHVKYVHNKVPWPKRDRTQRHC